jgi:hypothetical protein
MAHREPADILAGLEAAATITDAAQRYPKLNALQQEAIAAVQTRAALYAHVTDRAEALVQQAIRPDHPDATRRNGWIKPTLIQRRSSTGAALALAARWRPLLR